ncbi:protein brunelleschi [Eupeodes corollae]|uniref:protein brunelleschi n=1 Tax=Eupeodes corollae TaxID=290404 RepID=UPI00248F58DE|nr:protein brunelleschi [Eupeodes corollae]
MKSTVSYMLSHGSGEPVMSRPDYEQSCYHHGCLLVLLRGIGDAKPRSLQRIFDRVRKVNNVKITDAGTSREIWLRYIHDHPVENNEWGDFQTHRRLLGLITIGKFEKQSELNELCLQHDSLKGTYMTTLYDSRAILFGPPAPSSAPQTPKTPNENEEEEKEKEKEEPSQSSKLQNEFTTPPNFKSRAILYRENDPCADLETLITEFANSLFWVLDAKRLDRSREKVEKIQLLFAPFEKRDFVGIDLESRNGRKRCVGRVTKNLADLSLQAGLVGDALNLYHNACETLSAIKDSLWAGASEEGLCAASAILLYPQLREIETLHRNASLQEGSASPLKSTPEKWRASDLTKKVILEHQNSNEQPQITSNSSSTSSVSSLLTSSSSNSSSLSSSASMAGRTDLPGCILKPDEISVKYRKAIINYSKYRSAAVVETEASLKAARICIEQNKNLDVTSFLQNILSINLNMSDQDRVKRFEVVTSLYQQIGYRRKAAFFQRMAAWKHVGCGQQNPEWAQNYRLMLESFPGYMLSLDPLEVIENNAGWPALQIEQVQSLITAAGRLGHSALATRHMTFLLQTQWDNMTPTEQSKMAQDLQKLSAQCEGSPVPLVLDNGTVIPPANLTDIPYCLDLTLKDLPSHLRPQQIKVIKVDSGPFLFTPIHFSSIDRREKKKDKNKISFFWVQNDLSEITIKVRNPLPFELQICDMRLLTNGIVFESLPQTVKLQPSVPTPITLHGTPIEVGQLEIQGYSTHTLGVKSNCRLKHMRNRNFPQNYLIEVIPALPRISIKTSLPQTATFSTLANSETVITSASLTLYNGESAECTITIINDSPMPVEHLEMTISSNVDQASQSRIFHIDEVELQSQLPIPPKSTIDFPVRIFGDADFICPSISGRAASVHSGATTYVGGGQHHHYDGPQSLGYSTVSSGHASLPSRVSSPTPQQHQYSGAGRRNDTQTSSFRSSQSGGHSSLATLSLPQPSNSNVGQHVEAQFKIKYSGGDAMREGYCRQCAISFIVELMPSAQITSWDVLPAEIPSQFYLVLDVSNLTAQEMSLNYTNNKNILIEAKESCRVPIPVDRCSLESLCKTEEEKPESEESVHMNMNAQPSYSDKISKLCSDHIAERVNISWLLTGTEIQGIASLKGIILTPAMIDLTTVAPLQWTVAIQNTPVEPQSEVVCTAGHSLTLSITVCNQSVTPLKHLALTIQFYQDYKNGIENYNLDVIMSGPHQKSIPLLEKNEEAHHECTVMFFTPGIYKTNIQCRSLPPQDRPTVSASTAATATSRAFDVAPTATPGQLEQSAYQNFASYHESQQHAWKFIPPIEVTVLEQ